MNRTLVFFTSSNWRHVQFKATFATSCKLPNKNDFNRQGKIMNKLLGTRIAGSKQRWFDNPAVSRKTMDIPLSINGGRKSGSHNTRRTSVLNKVFMDYISDLLATGDVSQNIIGKGLQITHVEVTSNYRNCNIYWVANDSFLDVQFEEELQKAGGILRHQLSQLRVVGEVPRIHFVKDKVAWNLNKIDSILKTCDFGKEDNDDGKDVEKDISFTESLDPRDIALNHEVMKTEMIEKKHSKFIGKPNKVTKPSVDLTEDLLEADGMSRLDLLKERLELEKKEEAERLAMKESLRKRRFREKRRRGEGYELYRRIKEEYQDALDDGDYIEDDHGKRL